MKFSLGIQLYNLFRFDNYFSHRAFSAIVLKKPKYPILNSKQQSVFQPTPMESSLTTLQAGGDVLVMLPFIIGEDPTMADGLESQWCRSASSTVAVCSNECITIGIKDQVNHNNYTLWVHCERHQTKHVQLHTSPMTYTTDTKKISTLLATTKQQRKKKEEEERE